MAQQLNFLNRAKKNHGPPVGSGPILADWASR